MFEIKKNPKKIYVLGTGSGWELAKEPTDATIYCLNDYVRQEVYGIKPDILFMLDILDEKPQVISGQDDLGAIIRRINNMQVRFIAPYKYEEIPLSEPFPLDEAVKTFGYPYFSNTICYMICFAMLQGAEEIHLFGVNQASSKEYGEEKGGVEYWIGQALGRGIKVVIHGELSQVLKYHATRTGGYSMLYGYNQTYEQIKSVSERFGVPIVHKLTAPPKPVARELRPNR